MNNKYLNLIGPAFIFLGIILLIFNIRNNISKNREIERLKETIQNIPQKNKEVFVDSIFVKNDSIITEYKILEKQTHNSVYESSIPKGYMDSVAKALNIANNRIKEMERINTTLQKKLEKKDIVKSENKDEIYWKNEKAEVIANLKDSIVNLKYNAKITVTDYYKKSWLLGPKTHYTAVSTDDPDLTINGVQRFEQKSDIQCSRFNFGVHSGYGIIYTEKNFTLGPYVGFGINFKIF